jgi:DNA-binding XRE family transcriptional regulator
MPDFARTLKSEISRIAKKVARQEVESTRKASGAHRREIAELKREVAGLKREMSRLLKAAKVPAANPSTDAKRKVKFVPAGLRSHRAKLGISAEQYGKLIGASGQSVYKWEREKATPRQRQLAAIAKVRSIGKREALQMLAN